MAENKINTRIILRNADLSAWEKSSVALLKGEMALARLSGELSNNYKVRIGTGDRTWAQLSDQGQLIIPAANVEGLTEAIASLSTSYRECSDISELSTAELLSTYVEGDIAVEKKDIADGKQQYCAYRFSKDGTKWMALDGNYSAENVYFANDLSLAGSWTQVGNITKTGATGTFATAGKSVKTVFEEIFDKTVQPTLGANPTASITLTSYGTKEVGTSFSPSWSVSYTSGKYNTPWNSGTVSDGTTATAYSITDGTTTSAAASGTFATFTVLSGTSYQITGTVTHSDGTIAKDNKGNNSNPEVKRTSGTITASASGKVTGAFPAYYGFTNTPKANPTAITATNGNITVDGITYTRDTLGSFSKTSFAASGDWYELFYMIPTGKHTKWSGKDSNNVDLAIDTKTQATVTFMDNTTATYDVFVVRNAAKYAKTTCTMTFA